MSDGHRMLGDLEGALSVARETEARLTLAQVRAVALPSRIRILRALGERRATVTEIARRTGLAKSTALKHLRALEKNGLVARREGERLWIYYDLTRAGRAVGRLDPLRIVVLLASLCAAGLLAGAYAAWRWGATPQGGDPWHMPLIGGEPIEPAARGLMLLLVALAALVLASGAVPWLLSRRRLSPTEDAAGPTGRSSFP